MLRQLVTSGGGGRRWRGGIRGAFVASVLAAAAAAAALPAATAHATASPLDPTQDPAAVSWGLNRIDLLAKGTDGTLQHRFFSGRWSRWHSLGAPAFGLSSYPQVTSWGNGRLDVFARADDHTVRHRWYANGTWS